MFIADTQKTSTTISQPLPPSGDGEVLASCACCYVPGPVFRQWSSVYGTRWGSATLDIIFVRSGEFLAYHLRRFCVLHFSLTSGVRPHTVPQPGGECVMESLTISTDTFHVADKKRAL